MDGVPCRDGCYCAAPICLLYVNKLMKLVPIAIQLKKTPGPDNPIFLPSDRWFDWVLAKMYFRSADAQVQYIHIHTMDVTENLLVQTMIPRLSRVNPEFHKGVLKIICSGERSRLVTRKKN